MKYFYLKNAKQDDIVAYRGAPMLIHHVTAVCGMVTVGVSLLNEDNEWVKEPYAKNYPENQIVRLLGSDKEARP